MRVKRKPSRHKRGYGAAHDTLRRNLEPFVGSGRAVCVRCNKPIKPGDPWHLDHRDDRAGYLGAAHAICNLRAAAAKTNAKRARGRQPTPLRWSREWHVPDPGTVVDYGARIVRY